MAQPANPWTVKSTRVVYEDPRIKVREDKVLNHQGKELTYGLVESKNPLVCIVAANGKGEILLFRNYRYSLARAVWELPAGFTDGEDFLTAAQRELLEETGYESDDWTYLGSQDVATGLGKIPFTIYLARNVAGSEAPSEQDEQISEHTFYTIEEVEKLAQTGEIAEAFVLSALYLAKLKGLTI